MANDPCRVFSAGAQRCFRTAGKLGSRLAANPKADSPRLAALAMRARERHRAARPRQAATRWRIRRPRAVPRLRARRRWLGVVAFRSPLLPWALQLPQAGMRLLHPAGLGPRETVGPDRRDEDRAAARLGRNTSTLGCCSFAVTVACATKMLAVRMLVFVCRVDRFVHRA